MGEISQGAAVGFATIFKCSWGNENGGDEAGGDEEAAHDAGCGNEQLARIADASLEVLSADERHDGYSGFKPREAESEAREEKQADGDDPQPVWMLREGFVSPDVD